MRTQAVLTAFLLMFTAAAADACPALTDVTRESQESCGLDVMVRVEPEGDLFRCTVLIPLAAACPDQRVIQHAVLEVYDTSSEGDTKDHLLLVCPLANFTGCEMPGQTLEIRFKLQAAAAKRSYIILQYGKENPVTFRVRLESYVKGRL
jgi:hypothetical protein